MFRSFARAMEYLNRFTDYEQRRPAPANRSFNLDRTRALLEALNHPERSFRSIHIAGTKGKGSTAIMLESIFRTAGVRTGLYTSPHLLHLFERIQIDGTPIVEGDFLRALNRMQRALDHIQPTFFEILTAAAFFLFRRAKVEMAIVEVGLGGRLDATNVLVPELTLITKIDYDHTDILGKTLSKIAREKAGILKSGIPAITSERKREPWKAIQHVARKVGAPLSRLGREFCVRQPSSSHSPMLECEVTVAGERFLRLRLPAPGAHQAENAALAAATARSLGLSRHAVRRGIAAARIPGRIEVVRRKPEVIVDVAHNPVAVRALRKALWPHGGRCWLVFGTSRDKDYRSMLHAILPVADVVFLTRARSPRACPPEELARAAPFSAVRFGSVSRAVAFALKRAAPKDRILITGSFYVAGEALQVLNSNGR